MQQKYNKNIILVLLNAKGVFLRYYLDNLTMIYILLIFLAGIIAGRFSQKIKAVIRASSSLTLLSVLALLFLLGYEAGSNPQVQSHFDSIGIKALVISLLSLSGSILFVYIFNRLILKK